MRKDKSFDKAMDEEARCYGAELSRAIDRIDESIPDGIAEFSKDSEHRSLELIAAARKKRELPLRQFRVAACVLLAFVICVGGAVFSVEAWRERFINFFYNENAPGTRFYFHERTPLESWDNSLPEDSRILLGYIPDGFGLTEYGVVELGEYYFFENNAGKEIYIDMNDIGGNFSVDTEDATLEEICINDCDGFCITKGDHIILLWYDDAYVFTVEGPFDRAELLKVAEGIRYRE